MIRNYQISKEKAGFVTYSFLNSSMREFGTSYQISSDNLQKNNFHNPIWDIDKIVALSILKRHLRAGGGG